MTKSKNVYRKRRTRTPSCLKDAHCLAYTSWSGMMDRVLQDKDYLGLYICQAWTHFEGFLADMGDRPGREFSLGRKDHSQGYFIENCFWQLRSENSRESIVRNIGVLNSPTNREKHSKHMTGRKIWVCGCGKRRYKNYCKHCGRSYADSEG